MRWNQVPFSLVLGVRLGKYILHSYQPLSASRILVRLTAPPGSSPTRLTRPWYCSLVDSSPLENQNTVSFWNTIVDVTTNHSKNCIIHRPLPRIVTEGGGEIATYLRRKSDRILGFKCWFFFKQQLFYLGTVHYPFITLWEFTTNSCLG